MQFCYVVHLTEMGHQVLSCDKRQNNKNLYNCINGFISKLFFAFGFNLKKKNNQTYDFCKKIIKTAKLSMRGGMRANGKNFLLERAF